MRPGPALAPQLPAQQLGRVHFHDDFALEVPPGVEVQVGVAGSGKAVVTYYAVGDEIAGSGGDVVQGKVDTDRFDRNDPEWSVPLDGRPVDDPLPRDGRVHGMEEAQVFPK